MTDLALVLNAHREGRLVHRSVRSAQRAIERARSAGISVQFLAVLDRPGEETAAYFEQHRSIFDELLRVDEGDPGLARNLGAKAAVGRFVAFTDGDDLMGADWLAKAVAFLRECSDRTIAHPQYSVRFGGERRVWRKYSERDANFRYEDMLEENPWDIMSAAARAVYLDCPYQPAGEGFGYEDHHWNCETIGRGYEHAVVPETVYFIRSKREDSVLSHHRAAGAVFKPAELFAPEVFAKKVSDEAYRARPSRICDRRDTGPGDRTEGVLRRTRRGLEQRSVFARRVLRRLGRYAKAQKEALVILFGSMRLRDISADLPAWLLDEWRAINSIEPQLFPDASYFGDAHYYPVGHRQGGRYYTSLAEACGRGASHVFLVPWLAKGGSDLESINYANAVQRDGLGRGAVVIATEDAPSPWRARLDSGVRFVDFGVRCRSLDAQSRLAVLTRLLLQLQPECIHNLNSALGYTCFIRHGAALKRYSRLYVSVFCADWSAGRPAGYALREMPECYRHLTAVTADNASFLKDLVNQFGLDPARLHAHYHPAPASRLRARALVDGEVLEVLWAGRTDRQKRLDILNAIAEWVRPHPIRFHVYGGPLLDPDPAFKLLARQPNVVTYGPYERFEALPLERFHAYLYTSAFDGLPNVLLEAQAAGLPVIASDIGGIHELVRSGETGELIRPFDESAPYVEALLRLRREPARAEAMRQGALRLLEERHSPRAFVESLRATPGYTVAVKPDAEGASQP